MKGLTKEPLLINGECYYQCPLFTLLKDVTCIIFSFVYCSEICCDNISFIIYSVKKVTVAQNCSVPWHTYTHCICMSLPFGFSNLKVGLNTNAVGTILGLPTLSFAFLKVKTLNFHNTASLSIKQCMSQMFHVEHSPTRQGCLI